MSETQNKEPLWKRLIRPSLILAFYVRPLYPVFIFFVNIFQKLTGRYLTDRQYTAQTVKQFVDEKQGDKILKEIPAQQVELTIPAYWDLEGKYFEARATVEVTEPVCFCLLNNAEIVESNNIVTRNGSALFPDFFRKNAGRNNFRSYFRVLANIGSRVLLSRNKVSITYPVGIYIGGRASTNYYHWLIEFIPKLYFLNLVPVGKHVPILVDGSIKNTEQLLAVLRCFTDREIIFIAKGATCSVTQLYWAESFLQMTHDLKDGYYMQPSDCIISKDIIQNTVAIMMNKISHSLKALPLFKHRFIYISKRVKLSRNFNEEEVVAILSKIGFAVIYPEDLSFVEQVQLFQSAELIVGASGAWLTNVMFSNSRQTVLYFTWFENETIFSPLASASGAKLEKLMVRRSSETVIHTDFTVDTAILQGVVQRIIQERFAN